MADHRPSLFHQTFWLSIAIPALALVLAGLTGLAGARTEVQGPPELREIGASPGRFHGEI